MPFPGFCGGSYQSISPVFDAERTVNFIPEFIESPNAKTRMGMFGTMGSQVFAELSDAPMRQLFRLLSGGRERLYAAGGTYLYEILPDGSSVNLGSLGADGNPVFMAASQTQLAVVAGGTLFVGDLSTPVRPIKLEGGVAQVGFADGYFLALLQNGQRFQISGLLDGTSWDGIDVAQVSKFPDDILAIILDHGELWLFGAKQTLPYQNTGNQFFPWEPVQIGVIEQGIIAPASPQKLDNSIFWLSGDEKGSGIAYRAQGYTPSRISTHAMEQLWQTFARRDDAIGYTYQLNGHQFWVLRFPTTVLIAGTNQYLSRAFAYDVASGLWHDWSYWDPKDGIETAHQSQAHAYCWGKHLVANPVTGNVDELSLNYGTDGEAQIKRIRRTPWTNREKERVYFPKLELDMECGLESGNAPLLDGNGKARPPQVMLHWSGDGGKTFSNEHWRQIGKGGEYKTRVRWLRNGQDRGRVWELVYSDPVPIRIADVYL